MYCNGNAKLQYPYIWHCDYLNAKKNPLKRTYCKRVCIQIDRGKNDCISCVPNKTGSLFGKSYLGQILWTKMFTKFFRTRFVLIYLLSEAVFIFWVCKPLFWTKSKLISTSKNLKSVISTCTAISVYYWQMYYTQLVNMCVIDYILLRRR